MLGFPRFIPVLVLVGMATALWAQPNAPTPPTTSTEKAPAAASLSKEEIKARAQSMKADAEAALQDVQGMRSRAQKKKDVIKLTCVNDKLVQLKAQMNIADRQHDALEGAIDKQDDRTKAFTDLSDTSEGIRKLREEAQACMGETELYKQESGVEVDRPDIIDDPTIIDPYTFDPTLEVEPPGYASAYR